MDMNRSAQNQFKLLENPFAWAQVQRGVMQFTPVELDSSPL